MATLTIRNLPEPVRRSLKERAAAHNRSMEAEVRSILENAVAAPPDFIARWIAAAATNRGDIELPDRTPARPVDLS
ncbi:MAG: Arc family DNA-binding protein [Yonghaparkia sp.]|nr:Arc family DNA-binding protein [Microcella sp.]